MALNLIMPFMAKPEDTRENLEISQSINLFNLKEYKCSITRERIQFLKELYQHSLPEYRINKTSAVYFFKAGNAYIELDISITKDIHIKPYFHYQPEKVSDDLYKIVELDYLLYSILKINKLH